jgi:hypothetical protein
MTPHYPQRLHHGIHVSNASQTEQRLPALGATRAPGERETGCWAFTDPAGHPFCIAFGRHSTGRTGVRTEPATAQRTHADVPVVSRATRTFLPATVRDSAHKEANARPRA